MYNACIFWFPALFLVWPVKLIYYLQCCRITPQYYYLLSNIPNPTRGLGLWKLNTALLEEQEWRETRFSLSHNALMPLTTRTLCRKFRSWRHTSAWNLTARGGKWPEKVQNVTSLCCSYWCLLKCWVKQRYGNHSAVFTVWFSNVFFLTVSFHFMLILAMTRV